MRPRKKKTDTLAPERLVLSPWGAWYASKRPVFWFCGKFSFLLFLYYSVSLMPFFAPAIGGYLTANARVSHVLLNFFGEPCRITETTIWSATHAVTVLPTCSALELAWFFCAMVLSFPAPLGRRVWGILAGVPLLLGLNLVRIMSLYYVGVHFRGAFDTIHEEAWPVVLILLTIAICSGWIQWARADKPTKPDVAA